MWPDRTVLDHELLQEGISETEAIALQHKWRKICEKSTLQKHSEKKIDEIRWVAGVDISFPNEEEPSWGVACAVLWDLNTNEEVSHVCIKGDLGMKYIPGLLGFRESRLMVQAILQLPHHPDILMCDGHGKIHPRQFGEAVQVGLALNIPSFGMAKNPFFGEGEWKTLERSKTNKTPIYTPEEGEKQILGYAVCATKNCKPVFVSTGFKCSIETAIEISLQTATNHRQSEPLFRADQYSREEIKRFYKI